MRAFLVHALIQQLRGRMLSERLPMLRFFPHHFSRLRRTKLLNELLDRDVAAAYANQYRVVLLQLHDDFLQAEEVHAVRLFRKELLVHPLLRMLHEEQLQSHVQLAELAVRRSLIGREIGIVVEADLHVR